MLVYWWLSGAEATGVFVRRPARGHGAAPTGLNDFMNAPSVLVRCRPYGPGIFLVLIFV